MTDDEIFLYLKEHNFEVDARDCIRKVFNRSYQIIDTYYDLSTSLMTIITPNNTFTFKWNVRIL